MESWRTVWRKGFAPLLSTEALRSLRLGVMLDDPRLVQGATTVPPPIECTQTWSVEGACALGYAGWKGEELDTIQEVDEFFGQLCAACDDALGEVGASRWFIAWFDETPRTELLRELLLEIDLALAGREPDAETLARSTGDHGLDLAHDVRTA